MQTITAKELKERMKNDSGLVILDVRAEDKYEQYHINDDNVQSINIFKELILQPESVGESITKLPKEKEIIITCTTGNSARKCAAVLAEKEYNITCLEGGLTAWKEYQE